MKPEFSMVEVERMAAWLGVSVQQFLTMTVAEMRETMASMTA